MVKCELGCYLGAASLGLLVICFSLFGIVVIYLTYKIKKLEKAMKGHCRKERRLREEEEQRNKNGYAMSDLTPTDNTTSEIPIPSTIHATNMTYTSSSVNEKRRHHSYENTDIPQSPAEKSESSKAHSDVSQYSDVPAPLPGFLRNEEMLVPPTVSEDIIIAAQLEESLCKVEAKIGTVTKPSPTSRASHPTDDYVDPLDAKNIVAAKREHEKMAKKLSKGDSKPSPELMRNVAHNDREDYTEVSDALPQGSFAKIDPKALLYSGDCRNRTSSDTSPMLSSRSAESGKASNPSPKIEKKSNSLRGDRSKHAKTTKTTTTPVRRRSTLQQKELVCFDPNTAGFKLAPKRTNSDGTPVPNSETSDSQHNSPVSDPGQEFDKGFIQGGSHVYAAVDLTAKCRPDDDILRREGVGVPEHYNAPVPCN